MFLNFDLYRYIEINLKKQSHFCSVELMRLHIFSWYCFNDDLESWADEIKNTFSYKRMTFYYRRSKYIVKKLVQLFFRKSLLN